jgi:hypothetical protein
VFVTSRDRPLSKQAPYTVNVALDYDNEDSGTSARILYHVVGENIVTVGIKGLPDIYEEPFHELSASVSQRVFEGFRLKLVGKNLLNWPFEWTQEFSTGKEVVASYREGITISLGATYTY